MSKTSYDQVCELLGKVQTIIGLGVLGLLACCFLANLVPGIGRIFGVAPAASGRPAETPPSTERRPWRPFPDPREDLGKKPWFQLD
jgi:hypothetical protein